MDQPTLLVTGHRGLLGSACVRQLGHQYRILTTEVNLFHEALVRDFFRDNRPDYVIHCAAKVGGVKANRDQPVEFLTQNLAIQNNVIIAAGDTGVKKLVNIGTSCLYPKFAPVPVKESSLLTGPFEPSVSAYATAKLAGYALCNAYRSEYGVSMVTASPCNLYGPGDRYGASAHVIPSLMAKIREAMKTGGDIHVWGSGQSTREFMCSDDTARALGVILERYDSPDLINVGTGEGTSIAKLVYMLKDITGFQGEVIWDSDEPEGIPHKTFDISKLQRLGFTPSIELLDGLMATWNDFRENSHPRQ